MLTQQTAKDNLENILNKPIYDLDLDFWDQMREPYEKELTTMAENTAQLLRSGFSCDDKEIIEFMTTLDTNLHQHTSDYIRRLFRDINTNLLRRFNKDFKKDENGKNREWRDIEEPKIRELWQKVRAQMLEVINEFKYIKLPRGVLFNATKNLQTQ